MNNIADNLTNIQQQIKSAAEKAARPWQNITLLAVSKTKPTDDIIAAYNAGQRHFGENYIQEATTKIAALDHYPEIIWHFIGPVQSNKTRLIAEQFDWVHSVDREKIALRLDNQRKGKHTPLNVCLQVNISGEPNKSGVTVEELFTLASVVNDCEHLNLRGLMAIPEKGITVDDEQSNFVKMYQLFTKLQTQFSNVDTLSMGMSNDLEAAIASGSTMVRIGTAIFGQRN